MTLKTTKKIKQSIQAYLCALDQLHITLFSAYIKRDYFENRFYYEKKIINQTRAMMYALDEVRLATHVIPVHIGIEKFSTQPIDLNDGRVWYENIISRLENLYEIFFSLDLLKHRLIDHSTFEVCQAELKKISKMLSKILNHFFNEKDLLLYQELEGSIQALEILFQNTLQFVTADPLNFLFFIRDLKALSKELMKLQNEINT